MTKLPTDEQAEAIAETASRLAIVATPGSGKTFVLTERVAHYILDRKIDPKTIQIVTFTVAAANEFRERLEARGIPTGDLGYCGTIHGHALKLLRHLRKTHLSVISRELGDKLIGEVIKSMSLKTKPTDVLRVMGAYRERTDAEVAASVYRQKLEEIDGIEIDMLIPCAEREFSKLDKPSDYSIHLFIDEYQDTSAADARYLEALMPPEANRDRASITVVGDPDQAVYSFRGARPANFSDFEETATVLQLSTSFRLPEVIAYRADCLMDSGVIPVDGVPIGELKYYRYPNPETELMELRRMVTALIEAGHSYSDIAVLCRYNRNAVAARAVCKAYGFPVKEARMSNERLSKALAFAQLVTHRTKVGLLEWEAFHGSVPTATAIMETDSDYLYAGMIEAGVTEEAARWFCSLMRIHGIDQAISETRFQLAGGGIESNEDKEQLTITTMHGAKGLEFPVVIMLGCEQMTIPGNAVSDERVDEERRLFYVAMTRAKEKLILTYCMERTQHHSTEMLGTAPSEFMRESGIL